MGKHPVEVQERAYDLYMVKQTPFSRVVEMLRTEYGSFASGTLTKWAHDPNLNWAGRYAEYRLAVAKAADAARVKEITPILTAIQEIREATYQQLRTILLLGQTDKDGNPVALITPNNVAKIVQAFTQLADLELRKTGGGRGNSAGIEQVINVIIAVIERTPNVGPVFAAHRGEIVDAVFKEIEAE